MGYTLVEGEDLAVRNGRVMLKTLGGLLPVEVLLRRVEDQDCDPVELTGGDLDTIDHREFDSLLEFRVKKKSIIDLLNENGIKVSVLNGSIVEKTGLIAVAGTLKAIDAGRIASGSRVLCNLTSAFSLADGKAVPERVINSIDAALEYSREVRAKNHAT